ncbi:beta-1,4-N-acetylgalactosaminyltransferase bre-4 [Daphnia magna]|uniref:beta-1,4-N-acetylgalactosaminyltransferase bre-4 n=1 Tax=Daphnia magna TaxID=35525 RepID=UPI001E1BB5F1|nr:beta-1,4-N-acetylgalactosaminyltransferase bre-4 [Daphnia magna]
MASISHLRVIARPLLVISTFTLALIVWLNLNVSNVTNSIFDYGNPSKIQLTLTDSASLLEPISQKTRGNKQDQNLSEVAVNESSQPSVAHQSPSVTQLCPLISPELVGWTNISLEKINTIRNEAEMELIEAGLEAGGRYQPKDCQSRHKVAIVVPYRDRKDHLTVFLRYLHPFLQRQQLNYVIIVVEQSNSSSFNRGMLMNIGFNEAQLQEEFHCFIFHDVDFLPEDDGNPYTCPQEGKPRQMSFSIDYWDNYKPTPASHFGGVTAFSTNDFRKINGFSNSFWGWGGEDDQLYQRVRFNKLIVTRAYEDQPSLVRLVRYKTLSHKKAEPNPERKLVLKEGSVRFQTDGLNDLRYNRLSFELKPLYTHIIVDIQPYGGRNMSSVL